MTTAFRIGQGYDIHRLTEGGRLVLGGVELQHSHGLEGHSDADVLIHALIDALLGAAGLGDIGDSFPDTDALFKDADSTDLLRKVLDELRRKGWKPGQIDCTIVAERPKLGPTKTRIRDRLAELLNLESTKVNVKAKTAEGLGPTGRCEAIEALAVAVIVPS